ncbi:hypothetical protein BDA99DRAFT_529611, partial [Phascolomyces articulosus]
MMSVDYLKMEQNRPYQKSNWYNICLVMDGQRYLSKHRSAQLLYLCPVNIFWYFDFFFFWRLHLSIKRYFLLSFVTRITFHMGQLFMHGIALCYYDMSIIFHN